MIEIRLLNFSSLSVPVVFLLDQWRLLFFSTVITISLRVFIFRKSYMISEINYIRFHIILWLFVISILLLIFSPGFFRLILGWDGLGLSSFLLVIYYKNFKSLNAGLLTFFTNRLGDGFMLSGMFFGVLIIRFNLFSAESIAFSNKIVYLLVLGALTKRAQIPFRAWLPAAIAAPTPVSSLVHSSTLVTAGVYVVFRISDLLGDRICWILFRLGTLTILMARIRALKESDIKKIVALSTLSQLGLIFVALGRRQPTLRFFHLITHAFFKAIIFVGVGVIIHRSSRYQEIKVIGYSAYTPFILGIIAGANFSLCGIPFFSGFFRKEIILQRSSLVSESSIYFSLLFILRILLTQLYRIRFLFKVFFISNNFLSNKNFSEIDKNSIYSMVILFIPACLTGRYMGRIIKINFDFFVDPRFLKIVLSLIIIFRVFFRIFLFKKNINNIKNIFLLNLWLLPDISGRLFTKIYIIRDKNYKIFLNNIFERSIIYGFKALRLGAISKTLWMNDKIIKFSLLLGTLIVLLYLCLKAY